MSCNAAAQSILSWDMWGRFGQNLHRLICPSITFSTCKETNVCLIKKTHEKYYIVFFSENEIMTTLSEITRFILHIVQSNFYLKVSDDVHGVLCSWCVSLMSVLYLSRDVWSRKEGPVRCPGSQTLRLSAAAQIKIPAAGLTGKHTTPSSVVTEEAPRHITSIGLLIIILTLQ